MKTSNDFRSEHLLSGESDNELAGIGTILAALPLTNFTDIERAKNAKQPDTLK